MTISPTLPAPAATPLWLRIAAGIGIVWYAFGLFQFWLAYTLDPGAAVTAGQMTQAHAAAVASTTALVWLAFAIASGAGLAGSALLLLGSPRAAPVFLGSLAAALAYYAWVYGLSGTAAARPGEEIGIAATVILVTAAFCLLSRRVR